MQVKIFKNLFIRLFFFKKHVDLCANTKGLEGCASCLARCLVVVFCEMFLSYLWIISLSCLKRTL